MSWATTAPAIAAKLASVQAVGRVLIGDRHMRDEARTRHLLASPILPEEQDQIRACRIARVSVAEEPYCVGASPRNTATETYLVRLALGVTAQRSEGKFQAMVSDAVSALADAPTIGGCYVAEGPNVRSIAHAQLGGVLCHSADIALAVTERYTLTGAAPTQTGTHTVVRDQYDEIAGQLSAILGQQAENIFDHRPWMIEADESRSATTEPAGDDNEDRSSIRLWRMWRESDETRRGLGTRTSVATRWRFSAHWGWHDDSDSYSDFQAHLDLVRSAFREYQGLGNTLNPTCSISTPLQVTDIGARRLFTGVLCHFADCSIGVQEIARAA